jgi:hypothetical protein
MVSRARQGLRDRWFAAVLSSSVIGDACKLTLAVLYTRMTDQGYVSMPRSEIAALMGKHERKISEHIREARDAGLLNQIGGGYKSRSAQYVAVIPITKGAAERQPHASNRHPLSGTLWIGATGATGAKVAPKGAAERQPITRVTKRKPQTHAHERNVRVERDNGQEQGRSDRRVTRVIRLAELSPWAQLGYAPLLRRTA